MQVAVPDGRLHRVQRQGAVVLVGDGVGMNPSQRGQPAHFIEKNVAPVSQDDLIAPATVGQQAYQIAHGAAGKKQGGFLAQFFGGHILELVNGRVFVKHVISHLSFGHGFTHGLGGLGQGVTSQVNDPHSGLLGRLGASVRNVPAGIF